MIILHEIKIINCNNNPPLYVVRVEKRLTDKEQLKAYRTRLKQIAIRRYKKELDQVHIDLRYTET